MTAVVFLSGFIIFQGIMYFSDQARADTNTNEGRVESDMMYQRCQPNYKEGMKKLFCHSKPSQGLGRFNP